LTKTLLARALSSEENWRILDLLMTRQLTEPQIRKALGMSAPALDGRLSDLVNARVIDVVHQKAPSGREEMVYQIARSAQALGFPPRSYEELSQALITGLISSLGEKGARLVLRDIGLKIGEQMGRTLLVDTDSTELSMEEYANLVINGLFAAQGAYPRVVSRKASELTFEQFNCPFQELASKMPGLMCDVMDEGVHKGLDRALNVKTTRLSCMGHGDAACRFRVAPLP